MPSSARPRMRRSLPHRALISPLWHSVRKGWARSHVDSVLVEKRWWNTANARGERLVVEVEVEVGEGVGGREALVDHGAEGARRHVGALGRRLDAPAQAQRPPLGLGCGRDRRRPRTRRARCAARWRGRGRRAPTGSSGGSRQSTSETPSAAAAASTAARGSSPRTNSTATPAPSPNRAGGIGTSRPEPSAVRASAATAPRCLTHARPRRAAATMARDGRPWASATKPMPQASSSRVVGGSTAHASYEMTYRRWPARGIRARHRGRGDRRA